MNKVLAALLVMFAVVLGSLGLALPAQAYPDTPPGPTTVVQNESTTSPATAPATLPNTGGPDELLLAGALGLVLVGGVTLAGTRRRASE